MSQNIFSCGCPSNFDAIQRDALAKCTATPSGTKVIVKFRLNQHHTVVQVYEAHSEVSNVIDDVAGKFQVKAAFVELTHEQWTENPLGGAVMLCQLPYNEYGMIDMNIGLNKTTIREARVRTRDVCLDLDVFYRCIVNLVWRALEKWLTNYMLLDAINCRLCFRCKSRTTSTRPKSPKSWLWKL